MDVHETIVQGAQDCGRGHRTRRDLCGSSAQVGRESRVVCQQFAITDHDGQPARNDMTDGPKRQLCTFETHVGQELRCRSARACTQPNTGTLRHNTQVPALTRSPRCWSGALGSAVRVVGLTSGFLSRHH